MRKGMSSQGNTMSKSESKLDSLWNLGTGRQMGWARIG